jgi:DUF1009 family protein
LLIEFGASSQSAISNQQSPMATCLAQNSIDRADRRIGLLAGSGRFPVLFAEAARSAGFEVVCVAIRDAASPDLAKLVDSFRWIGIAKLGGMIRSFRRAGVRRVVMAGKVAKAQIYAPWRILRFLPDWRFARTWFSIGRRDRRDDSMLLAVVDEFNRDGIDIVSALDYCPELLVKSGHLTRRKPTQSELRDIEFGWTLAKEMGRLDVGQTVAVKELAALAVEAIEGTDRCILRAGELCPSGGFTVVKVAKPQQDMRFDVPTIGPDTIESLYRAGARVLAVEADKTILLDEAETIRLADGFGLTITALRAEDVATGSGKSVGIRDQVEFDIRP